jgi:hypothetical protein
MKKLKYIKIFEAFESIKLSKTLNYIKIGKDKFTEMLSEIAKSIDMPLSKYSDDYFQYLPFNKALELNFSYNDTKCDATSAASYPEYAVDGEVCKDGMVKRKWGRGFRLSRCEICKGTGIKKKDSYPIKWIKFWFDKDGRYILATSTDGQCRSQSISSNKAEAGTVISQNLEQYDIVKDLTRLDIRNDQTLPIGSIIQVTLRGTPTIGVIWRSIDRTYLIQNQKDGGSDDNTNDWKKYGRWSWDLSEYSGTPKLLTLKGSSNIISDEEKVNPYTWNAPLEVRYGSMRLSSSSSVESLLKDAHFALVLDFLEIRGLDYKKLSNIKKDRGEYKLGSTALLDNDTIKKANIERYIQEISNKIDIKDNIVDFKRYMIRFMGGSYIGFYILKGKNESRFRDTVSYFYRFMTATSETSKKEYYQILIDYIRDYNRSNMIYNNDMSNVLSDIRKKVNNRNKEYTKIVDALLELNVIITNKFVSYDISSIEDLDIILEKMRSIRNTFKGSDRYKMSRCHDIIEYIHINSNNVISYLFDIENIELTVREINRFKLFVERL